MQQNISSLLEKSVYKEAVIDTSMFLWKYIPNLSERDALELCRKYQQENEKERLNQVQQNLSKRDALKLRQEKEKGQWKIVQQIVGDLRPYYEISQLINAAKSPTDVSGLEEQIKKLEEEKKDFEGASKNYAEKNKEKALGIFKKKLTNS